MSAADGGEAAHEESTEVLSVPELLSVLSQRVFELPTASLARLPVDQLDPSMVERSGIATTVGGLR